MWLNSRDLKNQSQRLRNVRKERTLPAWDKEASELHGLISQIPSSILSTNSNVNIDELWHGVIQRALSHPTHLSTIDSRGRTPLHAACTKNVPLSVVKILLTSDVDINEKHIESKLLRIDNHGRTPLSLVIANKASFEVAKYLLEKCPNASKIKDRYGNLPLHQVCSTVKECTDEQLKLIHLLIKVFPEAVLETTKAGGKTALYFSIECGAPVSVVRTLVDANSSLRVQCFGETPLSCAIKNHSHNDILKCMVTKDPSICEIKEGGQTMLHLAIIRRANLAVIDTISRLESCIMETNNVGDSALHIAVRDRMRPFEIAKLLIEKSLSLVRLHNKSGLDALDLVYVRFKRCIELKKNDDTVESIYNTLLLLLRNQKSSTRSGGGLDEGSEIFFDMVQTNVPIEIVQYMALAKFPGIISRTDPMTGILPIFHVVNGKAKDREQIIAYMLKSYPLCARIKCSQGDYLLHKICKFGVVNHLILKEVIALNPASLEQGDDYGLRPFLLAALPRKKKKDTWHAFQKQFEEWGFIQNDGARHLDSIYICLREAPQVLTYLG